MLAKRLPDKEIYESVGVSRTTFHRWKINEIFQQTVSLFQNLEREKLSILSEVQIEPADCDDSRDDELEFRQILMPLLRSVANITEDLIEEIRASETLTNPRLIPALSNVLTEFIRCIRESNDRITGLESILDELSEIKKNL
ncbi:MAG: hypothetical protein F6K42_00575 [Leptolyngbya sp. SIO1D8]|nr:hypothetical protein [Leptolyngbya sp. SIO1D8]